MYRGTAAYSSIGYGMAMSSVEILIGRMLSTSEGQPSLGFCAAPLLKPDICVYLCLFFPSGGCLVDLQRPQMSSAV